MLAIRLSDDIESRLDSLAKKPVEQRRSMHAKLSLRILKILRIIT